MKNRKRTTVKYRVAGRVITIADDDRVKLELLLRRAAVLEPEQAPYLAALAGELQRATVVPRSEIPADVVTMNSVVRLRDLVTDEEETYMLVYPADADIEQNRLSVLAPVGTALIGYRAGDVVEWPVPAGVRRFRVEEVVSQPKPDFAGSAV
ncbi:MAG TPA: nucleoside diphosphate kinase regulator [Fimbriiglobus sp.]|nr:nucleoside diphosphate kinase regulator [Fimbriiglobus sp.]